MNINSIAWIGLGICLMLMLGGCTQYVDEQGNKILPPPSNQDVYSYTVKGKYLECIRVYKGVSCNWEKYNKIH